jgi:putative hemolysin
VFSSVASFATRVVGGGAVPQNMFITREALRALQDVSDSAANPSHIGRMRIRRVIRFADTTVAEAMIPLADVAGFNEMRNMKEAVRIVMKQGYNRLPVYRSNLINVKGMLTLNTLDLMDP